MTGLLVITLSAPLVFITLKPSINHYNYSGFQRKRLRKIIGWLVGAGSLATLFAYLGIIVGWQKLGLSFNFLYLSSGGLTALIAIFCLFFFPKF